MHIIFGCTQLHESLHPGHNRAVRVRQAYEVMGDPQATRHIREQHRNQSGHHALPERMMQEQNTRPLEIAWDYQLMENTTLALREYIVNRLMPAAAAVLKRAIRV